ncbi:hypothetical protein [Dactylosporangium sp. CS-033363]|uniref:hypothetical protein n=1 Tax=Dactylosporangium sp. CS-033363 TaxID=3239935 RepID=UPI003D92AA7A
MHRLYRPAHRTGLAAVVAVVAIAAAAAAFVVPPPTLPWPASWPARETAPARAGTP